MSGCTFRVLGPLEVVGPDGPVQLSPTQRVVLAVLLMDPRAVVSLERLVDAVWGTDPPPEARNSLQSHIARLRAALRGTADIQTAPPGYRIMVPDEAVDAGRFTALLAHARRLRDGAPHAAADLYDEALGLWHGPAFAEFADGAARPAAAALAEQRTAARLERAALALAAGDIARAVTDAEALAAEEPLRDAPAALLARALHAAGRSADALAVLRAHRTRLREELGLDGSPLIDEAETAVLRGDEPPSPRPAGVPGTAPLGRAADLAAATAALAPGAIVTLAGPGGVGKTTVARAVAAVHDQPVAWVDLGLLAEPDAVAYAVADALSARPDPGADVLSAAAAAVTNGGLVVLDNCEHVIASACAAAEALAAAGAAVLATSREVLDAPRERVHILDPLPVAASPDAPAVRLFLERAEQAGRRLATDPATLGKVAQVCSALDGLPLALELAAARLRSVTLEDLAARLDARFALLDRGRRRAPARHRGLRAVIGWSVDLLAGDERALLRRLAVFAGSFRLADAEEVCADPAVPADRIAGLVGRLVEQSLLPRPDPAGRYRMLQTVRAFAAEALDSGGDADTWRARHAAWVAVQAERAGSGLRGPEEARWVAAVDALLPDLRAARAWTEQVGDAAARHMAARVLTALRDDAYWRLRDEVLSWATSAADAAPPDPAVLAVAAWAAWLRSDTASALALAARGVTAAGGPDQPAAAAPLECLGDANLTVGDLDRAAACYAAAGNLRAAAGDRVGEAVSLGNVSLARCYAGAEQEAVALAEQAAAIADATGNPTARAFARYALGEALADRDPDAALRALAAAGDRARQVSNRLVAGVALTATVALRSRHGDPAAALASFRSALDHWSAAGAPSRQRTALRNLVVLLARVGADEDSAALHAAVVRDEEVFGAEADRLARAAAAVATRLPPEALAAAQARGRALDLEGAVALASEVIAVQSAAARAQR